MDVQVAESGPCSRTLTIKIPGNEVKQHLDRMFQAASQNVNLKGFRPGKVPRHVLEKKYGEAIQREAKEHLVRESVSNACREHELVTIGRAKLEGLGEEPLKDSDVEFTVQLDLRPEFELGEVKGIAIKAEPTEVTDEDMEAALKDLGSQKRTLEPIDDAVEESDFAKVDMTFRDADGNEVSKRENAQVNAGIPVAGSDPEQFKAALMGKKKGESFSIELTYPETFDKAEVRGKKGKVDIELLDVLRVQDPTLDDEFAKGFDFETIDALRTELRSRIGEQKVMGETNRQTEAILESIANDHPFPLPESLVEDEIEHSLQQFAQRMKEGGVAEEEIETRLEGARNEARTEAERRVRMFFLIDAVARKHELGVTPAEVDVELQNIAAQHNATIEQVREHFDQQEQANQLRLSLLERKVRDFLRENAQITDS